MSQYAAYYLVNSWRKSTAPNRQLHCSFMWGGDILYCTLYCTVYSITKLVLGQSLTHQNTRPSTIRKTQRNQSMCWGPLVYLKGKINFKLTLWTNVVNKDLENLSFKVAWNIFFQCLNLISSWIEAISKGVQKGFIQEKI